MRNFSKLNIDLRGHTSGHVKTFCPFCHEHRHDKRDKSLSVDIDKGLYKCHYCDAQGYVPDEDEERRKEERRRRREERQNQLPRNNGHIRPAWVPEFMIANCVNQPDAQPLINYLTQQRGLTLDTLQKARVSLPYIERETKTLQRVIAFNYFDHGIFINQKNRTLDKQFRFIAKAELIPYNIDAILRRDVCYITEGEFDTLTLVQCGFPEAISVPNGSQKNLTFLDRFVETHFDDKQLIVLALDNDPKGEELKNELLRRLGEERCRIVEWSADCKDANEELVKHGAESVITRVKAAKEMNDINGSADFGNMTDYCLCVDRDDDLKVVSVYVDKVKFKHLGTRGVAFFHYDGLSGRYVPCQLERVPKGVDLPEGNVPGRQGTVVPSVLSSTRPPTGATSTSAGSATRAKPSSPRSSNPSTSPPSIPPVRFRWISTRNLCII